MTPAKLTCEHARYDAQMMIACDISGTCAHQKWCNYKGWAELTPGAGLCRARFGPPEKEAVTDERKAKTAKKRRNKV